MKLQIRQVLAFHQALGYPINSRLASELELSVAGERVLKFKCLVENLSIRAEEVLPDALEDVKRKDRRLYRLHLLLEELAELAEGLSEGDEVKTADAIADMMYVLIGTAVTLGIPIDHVFGEVHNSNMTKMRNRSDYRMRNKGDQYKKPDIAGAIVTGRQDSSWCRGEDR